MGCVGLFIQHGYMWDFVLGEDSSKGIELIYAKPKSVGERNLGGDRGHEVALKISESDIRDKDMIGAKV